MFPITLLVWIPFITSGILGLMALVFGQSGLFIPMLFFLLMGGGLYWYCLREIPADPPHKGILTVWGERTDIIIDEGKVFLFPAFPFFVDVIRVNVVKQNKDFVFPNVRCVVRSEVSRPQGGGGQSPMRENLHSGGALTVSVSLTYCPDSSVGSLGDSGDGPEVSRLIAFENAGGHAKVEGILRDMTGEIIRQAGASHTWEEMTFGKELLTVQLLAVLTGEVPERLEPDPARPRKMRIVMDGDHPVLTDPFSDEVGDQPTKAECLAFINKVEKVGFADIKDLGVRVFRLNVVNVDEEGELRAAAEKRAIEEQERRREDYELETDLRLARAMVQAGRESGVEISFDAALREVRVRRQQDQGKNIITLDVDAQVAKTASEMLAHFLSRRT